MFDGEKMFGTKQRREIANFLKSRRDRLKPEMVGLTRSGRRRTPGLRREEVAMLAGISPEWYTWLEQARDIKPSQDTLEKISQALKLEPGETEYLLLLCGYQASATVLRKISAISPELQRVLDRLECTPAYVLGRRWDILGWNENTTIIAGNLAEFKGIERNCLWQIFLGPVREMLVDWEEQAQTEVARFRAEQAQYANPTCPWVEELVETLRTKSPEFDQWWQQYDVKDWHTDIRRLKHPIYGLLSFEHSAFKIADRNYADLKLITYVPLPGTDTLAKLKAGGDLNSQTKSKQQLADGM
ncbi:MAG: helix-turn-helix transcriptional regulator [Pleurocapsa sp.]